MNETRPNHSAREPGFDQRSLARVAGSISELPAFATQDWVERCAKTLTGIDPWCRVGVGIVPVDATGKTGQPEAAGVRVSDDEGARVPDAKGDLTQARARFERITDLGLALPVDSFTSGLAASADDLGAWRDGPLGRVWGSITIEKLLIGIAPLNSEPTDRVLIVLVALNPAPSGHSTTSRASARTLGALLPLVARRAWLAMPATGPILWLTDREQDVLDRLILGRSVREIAEQLERSPHTVHDHVKSLHRKLGASSRGELVARALGQGGRTHPDLDPPVIERVRASAQIEAAAPGVARRGNA